MLTKKKCTNYIVVSLLTTSLLLAQNNDQSKGAYTKVFIQRVIGQLDVNYDGNYDQKELGDEWKKYASLDQNQDGILSPEELQKIEINYLSSKGEKKLNVLYKKTAEEDLYFDIYYPTIHKKGEKLPVVMYTHGGGWALGSKNGVANNSFKAVSLALLEKGFCVVSVNYRLWHKEGNTSMRDCVIDAKDALRYLSKNNKELDVDKNRFYSFGDSAGGQIAQMLLLASPESLVGDASLSKYNYKMIAGVSWYGPCDFEKTELFNYDDRPDFRDRFGPRITSEKTKADEKLALYREMSPINYLKKCSAPLLMIQGDKDTTIPVKHAYYMDEKAKKIGAEVTTIIVNNAGHNWRRVDNDINPTREAIEKATIDFLVSHLK
jgi:acetyl esterase/lipase